MSPVKLSKIVLLDFDLNGYYTVAEVQKMNHAALLVDWCIWNSSRTLWCSSWNVWRRTVCLSKP